MIPLVDYEQELEILRELVVRIGDEQDVSEGEDYTVGTMIELPRACFVADRIAKHADFFSFGTNDLTQTALGFSRDDVESKFVPAYMERKIIDRSPFETIDKPGVGWLVRLAAWVGREAHPGAQARDLRRARRRPGVDRLLPHGRAGLRVLLDLPRADRPRGGRAGADRASLRDVASARPALRRTLPRAGRRIIGHASACARRCSRRCRVLSGRARARRRTARCARPSSATATGSSTPRRSGG